MILIRQIYGVSIVNCDVDDPCSGITSTGSSVAEMLSNLHQSLCGCVYVIGNIDIRVSSSWPDATQPLEEADFSFLYHIREIRGYLYFFNIPQIERLSLPNLVIIRGQELHSFATFVQSAALSTLNSNIQTFYTPHLTEITNGNAQFIDTISLSICNVMEVDWTDILSSSNMAEYSQTNGCTGTGKHTI